MRKRFFLVLVGFSFPLAGAASGALGGCMTIVEVVPPPGTGGRDGGHFFDGGGGGGGGPIDAQPDYEDPGCPDAGAPMTMFVCDPYNQNNGDCPPDEACDIFTNPPQTPCGQEVYGSECVVPGHGAQGAPCDGSGCAAGFTCVVSGSGNQCVQLCELQGNTGCPGGLVCEPIDVQGFGGCL